jgi:sterol desaturase/sphingolipid hydroxylase (fatty acid hydroxylase superfamily)
MMLCEEVKPMMRHGKTALVFATIFTVSVMVWIFASVVDGGRSFWVVAGQLALVVILAQIIIWITHKLGDRWAHRAAARHPWLNEEPQSVPIVVEQKASALQGFQSIR